MKWLNSLEARFGHLAIPGLVRIVIVLNVLVFLILLKQPAFIQVLEFEPGLILHGQVWRLVSYIFIPPVLHVTSGMGLITMIFAVNFLWFISDGLEHAWGSFKLNIFYFSGMLFCTVGAFLFPGNADVTGGCLNLTLLFAFATLFPDVVIYMFFIIPMKMKWLAYILFFFEMIQFLGGPPDLQIAVIASVGNYILFFGPFFVETVRQRQTIAGRRRRFENEKISDEEPLHRCLVCKRTERTNPELDFRVARDGNEYCAEHLPKGAPPIILES